MVKGLNWLYAFKRFDIIKSVGIDYMHSILLGVVKKLLEAWFFSTLKLKPWYIGNSINILGKKLRNIKTPNVIGRIPGSFNDLKQWKASEYRNFPLFYSVPVSWKTQARIQRFEEVSQTD